MATKKPRPKRKKPLLSPYEENALREIRAWKQPKSSWFDGPGRLASWAAGKAQSAVVAVPGGQTAIDAAKGAGDWVSENVGPKMDYVIEKTVGGLISVLNDGALWSVRQDAIIAAFGEAGHSVRTRNDIFKLDLEDVDRTIGSLSAKYKALALAGGGAAGAAGLPGIAPDVGIRLTKAKLAQVVPVAGAVVGGFGLAEPSGPHGLHGSSSERNAMSSIAHLSHSQMFS